MRLAGANLQFREDITRACERQTAVILEIRAGLGYFSAQDTVTDGVVTALRELEPQVSAAERTFRDAVALAVADAGADLSGTEPERAEALLSLKRLMGLPMIGLRSTTVGAVVGAHAAASVGAAAGLLSLLPGIGFLVGTVSGLVAGGLTRKSGLERMCDAAVSSVEDARVAILSATGDWVGQLRTEVEEMAARRRPERGA